MESLLLSLDVRGVDFGEDVVQGAPLAELAKLRLDLILCPDKTMLSTSTQTSAIPLNSTATLTRVRPCSAILAPPSLSTNHNISTVICNGRK
jgi:hypothetical protein